MGQIVNELRKSVYDLKLELDKLGGPISYMPELIDSANLLRSNEHLDKVTKKQSELISAYAQYSQALEDMIAVIFDIQNDLKNLLKEQSKLISEKSIAKKSPLSKKKKSTKSKK